MQKPVAHIKLKPETRWTEYEIISYCEYAYFYALADKIKNHFNIHYCAQIDDFDSLWWDFHYNETKLTIHYHIYLGIVVFPSAFDKATETDNLNVTKFAQALHGLVQHAQHRWKK